MCGVLGLVPSTIHPLAKRKRQGRQRRGERGGRGGEEEAAAELWVVTAEKGRRGHEFADCCIPTSKMEFKKTF